MHTYVPRARVTEGETARLIAWNLELHRVHQRLRDALQLVRQDLADGSPQASAGRDLQLLGQGFCVALDGHHRGEDHTLFPAVEAAHPELGPALRALQQDHSMIGWLLDDLERALLGGAPAEDLGPRVDGVAAIMESHFRYEERTLMSVLETLSLQADPTQVLGPLRDGPFAGTDSPPTAADR